MPLPEDNKAFTRQVLGAFPLDNAVEWIRHHMDPEDVFTKDQLEEWAEFKGYKVDE